MQLAAGELWDGRYRVEHVLGRGASGVVYRARDEHDGDTVALKVLRREAMNRGDDASLRLEFALLARFRHPNVVAVRRFATAGEVPYLVVELVDGPTLDRAIAASEPAALLGLAGGVLRGLAYLHANGFVHQDVKPSNILVDAPGGDPSTGTPKLADFGVASLRGVEAGESVSGTLPFLSPERLRGAPADPRADLWALGITLHACAAGRLPVKAQTSEQLARQLDTVPIAPLRDLCPSAPVELERFTARLLANDPRERYRDANEALADLERAARRHAGVPRNTPVDVTSAAVTARAGAVRLAEPALVGREPVITRARQALGSRPQPVPRTILIRAPDGLGRSRVLDELAIGVQLAGGVAVAVARRPGLAPWVAALAELSGARSLGRVATELITAPATAERIADVIAVSPSVLVVDDLHRRDGLARDMVDRIAVSLAARRIRHLAGVIAGTAPAAMIADRAAAIAIDLPPLRPQAIRELLGSVLGGDPTAAVAQLVIDAVGGSPALAVDAVRELIATGELTRVGGVWELVGDGVAAVRRGAAGDRRIAGLSPPARAALDALAVFGSGAEVDLAVLRRAADLDDDAFALAIEAVCAAQLVGLVPSRDGRGSTVRHRSEAVRASCAAAIDPAARAAIHRRAWDALRTAGVTDPELLCEHAVAAGLRTEAVALALAAADAAHARGDHLSALAAADLAASSGATAIDAAGIAVRRARAQLELGRVADARAALGALPAVDAAAADAHTVTAALLTARAVVAAGDVAATATALAALEQLDAAGRLDPAVRAELAVLRVESARQRSPGEAQRVAALELPALPADDRCRVRIHTLLGQAAMATVELERARTELETGLAIAERIDDPAAIVECRGWLAAVCDMSDHPAEAHDHVDRGLELAARAPAGVPFARLLNLRGILAMWTGKLDAAAESLLEAERRARLAGGGRLASSAAGNLVVVHRRQGLYGQALAAALRSLQMKRALKDRAGWLTTFINLTDLYTEFGDHDLAEACARRGIAGGHALGHRRMWAQGQLSLAACLVDKGDYPAARAALEASEGAVDQHNQVELWLVAAKLARCEGDPQAALAQLALAIERTRNMGNAHDEGRALVERAALVGELGLEDLRRAADVAGRSGSRGVAWTAHARLAAALRTHGDPTAADRELARARELLALVLSDLSPRHQQRYRTSPVRRDLIAVVEAAAPGVPGIALDGDAPPTDEVATISARRRTE